MHTLLVLWDTLWVIRYNVIVHLEIIMTAIVQVIGLTLGT